MNEKVSMLKHTNQHVEVTKHTDRIEHRERGTLEEGDRITQHDKIVYDYDSEAIETGITDIMMYTAGGLLRIMFIVGVVFAGCYFIPLLF